MASEKAVGPELAIAIVPYQVRELLGRCLRSLRATEGVDGMSIWVVDSGSTDGTVDMVRREFPEVNVIAEPRNVLYVRANNIALREIRALEPRNVLLLNPDTEVPPDALRRLLDLFEQFPRVGLVGPRLVMSNGELDWACRRGFPSPSASFFHLTGLARLFPRSRALGRYRLTFLDERAFARIDSPTGAFMLMRRQALADAGWYLDDAFRMYGEDLDLSYRIRQVGWDVVYEGRVDVLHHKRASSAQNPSVRAEFYRAMQVFFRKHYAPVTPLPVRAVIEAGIAALRLRAAA